MIKKSDLIYYWNKGTRLFYKDRFYRVGKMSYGQYFLEPGKDRGEQAPFNKGTLWLEKCEFDKNYYTIGG